MAVEVEPVASWVVNPVHRNQSSGEMPRRLRICDVAQLGERRIVNPQVLGSSPSIAAMPVSLLVRRQVSNLCCQGSSPCTGSINVSSGCGDLACWVAPRVIESGPLLTPSFNHNP